ncbi:peptide-methionine (R)-S-oxide reductase MsrB [Rhodobacter capsulatus]|jgi:peptide-methionine (R)-S-oxide reductase|uniref:peptide-methionine (R)-S-oxide reductase n=1 Tax=Rhodobacter capsulatus (strain ATCC BAA-309 / NBRC 16581 / SB1003) TaxID=272942 RepID=D5ARW1_RHOCB|nr:peptide-methionine (R)-S-oxide reductase MsrB [Rhodobacter capsulatus]ADE86983.1 peptide-methionine (R)-S-oxide reductase-1 [Rhodobacter capsulatus SB 1003]ETD00512.1 methionine sulfoxide reductase [Rhodobacter capsulatus DE442]ETD74852.1 methionine sulfoxide reductase [Rhodobacter capsulatus R121]ETD80574.1 methionine sulfoxide reductase [Rhodobacter capsulatus B6]ETD80858.1 methionine sulfoxide reductase [Rhodobacter capsulatus YW1]
MNRRHLLLSVGLAAVGLAPHKAAAETFEVVHSDEEWRKLLSPEAYSVLRKEGTEYPYTSPLEQEHRKGTFACAGCGQALFASETKFDSGTGWPSFYQPIRPEVVGTRIDGALMMTRTEVHCARCGGHLGHVFEDGPPPTGLRYCMNGVAMTFTPET